MIEENRSSQLILGEFPRWDVETYTTLLGTKYLREPGIATLCKPDAGGIENLWAGGFLWDFDDFVTPDEGEDGADYLPETFYSQDDWSIPPAEALVKATGQLCYLSFGERRTKNAERAKYFRNILDSGHGSVMEHPNFSFLFYGISRSLTHELVRHRAGFAFSQVSQRYVDGTKLRFVQRPEFLLSEGLDTRFRKRINAARDEYSEVAQEFLPLLKQLNPDAAGMSRTDVRKALNQVARAVLPNETEAPIAVTANIRAWRHFFNMRGSLFAEPEIRRLAVRLFRCMYPLCPELLPDIKVHETGDFRGEYLTVGHPKV